MKKWIKRKNMNKHEQYEKTHEKNIMKTKWTKLETRWWRNIWQHQRHIECWVWPQNMDHWRCFLANTSGWYYSIEGNRALKDKRKGQWNQFYFQKNKKIKKKKISNNLKQSKTISNNLKKSQKKTRKISKYLKISLMLFLKRGFARLGSLLHIFLDHRKSQKISKNLKIIQICRKKAKKRKKTIKPNKLMQTYKNLGPSLRFLPCFLKQ